MRRTQYRRIKWSNQLREGLRNGAARKTISVGLSRELYDKVNDTAIAEGKSQALIVNELIERGFENAAEISPN